jgi:LemA protein
MGWIVVGILLFGMVGSVLYIVGIYNGLISLKHAVDKAWADIDVLLKQRHDELPKLVDTVKGYMAHEREVLEGITEARAHMQSARTVEEKSQADGEVRGALARLNVRIEQIPDVFLAGPMGIGPRTLFEAEEGDRQDVKIDFPG